MSLFPAYAANSSKDVDESSLGKEWSVPAAMESQLLASDEEPPPPPRSKRARSSPPQEQYFYLDTKLDYGNLRVSTLYYPGRPEYRSGSAARALGAGTGAGAARRRAAAARRRYWQAAPAPGAAAGAAAADAAARAAALRRALAAAPGDEDLWLRYIEFQAEWSAGAAELEAAREAAAAAPGARVRAALHRARERHLAAGEVRAELRADLAAAPAAAADVRLELWTRLLEAEGAAGAAAAVREALAALPAAAYPHVLYVHGCVARAAGLWERLVLTVELLAAIAFPPASAFPPPPDPAAAAAREEAAQRREDQACRSGLPLSVVWARVERIRAAAHWRPAGAGAGAAAAADGDPQRAPAAAEAAEAVRAVRGAGAGAAVAAAMLRLAGVPLLPSGEHAARGAGPEPAAGAAAAPATLAALFRAARRLPPAHPARPRSPAHARACLAPLLDPPHYFSDADGYLSWTNALWEACCGWTEGRHRLALVCWRLRWLHALALLADAAERRRLRAEARLAVKRHAPAAPEAYAHFARLEAEAGGAAAGRRAAAAAARAAAAAAAAGAAPEAALFAARVLRDLSAEGEAAPAAWALCCAALGRPLPADGELGAGPPRELRAAALRRCAERCAELERGFEAGEGAGAGAGDEAGGPCAAMLPGAGEWAAAHVTLAAPPDRARMLARLLADRHLYREGAALQYGEQAACALALGAGGAGARAKAARDLLPLFPRNALLALVCGGAPLWAGGAAAPASARAGLALAVPRLLRAPFGAEADAAGEAGRLAGACARLARRGAGGALLAALRLEAEARAPRPRLQRALFAALAAHPDHKWLYVRGAAWCGAEAGALCDAVLERGLRLHALLDELTDPALHCATRPATDPAVRPATD